jgi:hypothetical protein
MMVEGTQVHVQARVEQHRKNPNRIDLRIKGMILLAELMEKFARKMVLDIPLADLDEDNLSKVTELILANPGKCDVMFKIRDAEQGVSLGLFPRKLKVDPAALTRELKDMEFLDIWLNGNKLQREIIEKDTPVIE